MSYPLEPFGTAYDGTLLNWNVIAPSGVGPWPGLIVLHVGGYRTGTPTDGPLIAAARDLAAAGIICYSIAYRLSQHRLPGQTLPCYWPYQIDDIMMAALKARADSRCNGNLGAFGGSAGGGHGLSVASQIACLSEVGPAWGPGDRVKAALLLSPSVQFDGRQPYSQLQDFINAIDLYTNTTDLVEQKSMSPTSFMDETCSPIFVAASEADPMPPEQFACISNKITELGLANCQMRLVPGSKHAFGNWSLVKDDAIAWLQERLAA